MFLSLVVVVIWRPFLILSLECVLFLMKATGKSLRSVSSDWWDLEPGLAQQLASVRIVGTFCWKFDRLQMSCYSTAAKFLLLSASTISRVLQTTASPFLYVMSMSILVAL